jgi:hypothetical protein
MKGSSGVRQDPFAERVAAMNGSSSSSSGGGDGRWCCWGASAAGGTGGVGKRVVQRLLQQGRVVRALVRDVDKAKSLLVSCNGPGRRSSACHVHELLRSCALPLLLWTIRIRSWAQPHFMLAVTTTTASWGCIVQLAIPFCRMRCCPLRSWSPPSSCAMVVVECAYVRCAAGRPPLNLRTGVCISHSCPLLDALSPVAVAAQASLPVGAAGALQLVAADISQRKTLTPDMFRGVCAVISCTAVKVQPKEGDTVDRQKYYQVSNAWGGGSF